MNLNILIKRASPIIKHIFQKYRFNDEPHFYFYQAILKEKKEANATDFFSKKRALFKLLGEAIERFYLRTDYKKIVYATPSHLISKNKKIIDPREFVSFLSFKRYSQIEEEKISNQQFGWIKGISLISGKEIFVPAQFVFVPYRLRKKEPLLGPIISTGASCHFSLKKAITNGLLEVIERDAFMIMYLNKTCRGVIEDIPPSSKFSIIFSKFKKYNLKPYVIDISTDVPVYSIAGLLIDKTGLGPAVSIGAKSSFNLEEAIIGAFEEAIKLRTIGKNAIINKEMKKIKKEEIGSNIVKRALFWSPIKNISKIEFFWKTKKISYKKILSSQKKKSLESLLQWFKEKHYEVIYVDLTPPPLKKDKIFIVKVLVPQFQPLYLDERFPVWEGPRLREVPKILGLKYSKKINTFPHPFL